MNKLFNGLWSGLIATGPMTLAFFEFFKNSSSIRNQPLPPSQLTAQFEKAAGLKNISNQLHSNLTMASHFGYGAASGTVYSFTLGRLNMNPLIKGSLFGFSVWALSYLGWIPAANLHPQAKKMTKARNTMMIVSHLIWGASLAYADSRLQKQGTRMLAKRN